MIFFFFLAAADLIPIDWLSDYVEFMPFCGVWVWWVPVALVIGYKLQRDTHTEFFYTESTKWMPYNISFQPTSSLTTREVTSLLPCFDMENCCQPIPIGFFLKWHSLKQDCTTCCFPHRCFDLPCCPAWFIPVTSRLSAHGLSDSSVPSSWS